VRTLVETGVLVQEQSPFRLTRRVEEIEIPETVQSVLAARIDRLPAPHRRLLQIASVIGRDVPLALLQEVAAMPHAEMTRQLAELQEFEFLYEVSLPSGTEYTFKHALTHEVAYEGMLLRHRRALHASVLAAIEAGHAGRLDALTERLAEHAWKGEVWDKAVDYYYKAGQRANEGSAHGIAIDFLESALDALSRLPKESATIARGVDIRLGLRIALGAAADFVRLRQCLHEAEELATAIGDQRKLALITISRSTMLSNLGALDEALAAGERARRIAGETGEWASRINAAFALGQAYWFAGALPRAAAVLEAEEAALKTVWRRRSSGTTGTASVLCLGCLANTYSLQGEFARALACSAEAVAIASELERPYDLSYAHIASGLALLTRGEVDPALEHLEKALDHARGGAIPLLVPSTARYLGRAYAEAGRSAEARALLAEAIAHARANTLVGLDAWCSASLALALLAEDAHGEAAATAQGALDLAARYGYRPIEVYAMRLLGKIEAAAPAGDAGAAARHYRDAIALGTSLGMRPETALCQEELAGVLERLGESAAALAAAQAAADLYRACGMERRR
jgi:predicted ATPase